MVKKIGGDGEGEEDKQNGQGYLSLQAKGLPLDREQTVVARGQRTVYKGKGGNPS